MRAAGAQSGLTLVELLLVMAISTIIFAALTSVVSLGLKAQSAGSTANEQVYGAGFALERIVLKTRAAAPRPVSGNAAATTGTWLAPVMFCLASGTARLMETTDTDTACSSGAVLAENVSAFSAQLASNASTRATDAPVIIYSLTVSPPDAPQPISLTSSVRLGGGIQ
jgi:prepilin-type N-terminal cleavage/methylation domain-containing protein